MGLERKSECRLVRAVSSLSLWPWLDVESGGIRARTSEQANEDRRQKSPRTQARPSSSPRVHCQFHRRRGPEWWRTDDVSVVEHGIGGEAAAAAEERDKAKRGRKANTGFANRQKRRSIGPAGGVRDDQNNALRSNNKNNNTNNTRVR